MLVFLKSSRHFPHLTIAITMSFVPDPFWNEVYSQEAFVYGKEPNHYLQEKAAEFVPAGSTVLCIADGEGRNGIYLAKQACTVVAFDASDVARGKALKFAQESGLQERQYTYTLSDCEGFPGWQAETYDAIAGIFIQFAKTDGERQRLFADVYKALKPGGVLILQGYTPKQLEFKTGGPPTLAPCYTEEMIRALTMDASLEIVELQVYEKELQEGFKHNGMSALLGLTARKPKAV